jgi:DivIVA domain-containing protein
MSSDTTASTGARGRFDTVRSRGYRPDQVDRFLDELSEDRDAAWERAARLTVLANEMDAECVTLRQQVQALTASAFDVLGPGAQELLQLVEEEAAAVRDRAEVESQYARDAADTARRTLQDETRAAAAARVAAADDHAQRVLDEASRQAAEMLGGARAEAEAARGEAVAALDAIRDEAQRGHTEAERARRERLDALQHELAERDAGVDSRLADLLADAERQLAEAHRERAEAEEALRAEQAEAEARASTLIAQARAQEERVRREAERALREHEQHRDDIRAHLAHIRTTLAALTGRTLPEDREPPTPA